MKNLKIIIMILLFGVYGYAQEKVNISSVEYKKDNKAGYFNIVTDFGDEIKIKASNINLEEVSIYAEKNFCTLIYLKNNSVLVSAVYKEDNKWVQDYHDRMLAYPANSYSTVNINEIKLVDANNILVNYKLKRGNQTQMVDSNIILGSFGFFDSYQSININLYFKNVGNLENYKSPRISNFELIKRASNEK